MENTANAQNMQNVQDAQNKEGKEIDCKIFRAYLDILRELSKQLEQLAGLENRKLEAVRANEVKDVDDCIRQEQVISLSLRGLEQRRDKALKAMGLEGIRLSGLIECAPSELRWETIEVVGDLQARYRIYRSASSAARSGLERVLHQVDRMLAAEQQRNPTIQPVAARRNPRDLPEEPPVGGHGADFKV